MEVYDFSGYATRNDVECTDGRIIRHNAFVGNDGDLIPLVWQHGHTDVNNVLGHALLENRADGVYAYAVFSKTPNGEHARELVKDGTISALSIYANKLQQNGQSVIHGDIKEVSLVMSGANPGAFIDNVMMHSDGSEDDEAVLYFSQPLEMFHSDDMSHDELTVGDVFDSMSGTQQDLVYSVLAHAAEGDQESYEAALELAAESLTDDQLDLVEAMVDHALEEGAGIIDQFSADEDDEEYEEEETEVAHSRLGGTQQMRNVFENQGAAKVAQATELLHDDIVGIVSHGVETQNGMFKSMLKNYLTHAEQTYGIKDLDILFPEARVVNGTPIFIKRDTEWVAGVLAAVNKSPFARIKSTAADITEDEARARGYIKGDKKVEEVFSLLQRTTTPQTMYKKQKLDRDDIIDITTMDVVVWMKSEMRLMLNEEIARVVLVGDGRPVTDRTRVKHEHVRPIAFDDELYSVPVTVPADITPDQLIDTIIRSRKLYKGTGTPNFYTTTDTLTDMLLVKDKIGRNLYPTIAELKSALRVNDIVEVPVLEGVKNADKDMSLLGIFVNLTDYTIGADKGGEVSSFEDFDIDFNQLKYLIETRISGALTRPFAALVFWKVDAAPEGFSAPVGAEDQNGSTQG